MKTEIWPAYTRGVYTRAILQSLRAAGLLYTSIFHDLDLADM